MTDSIRASHILRNLDGRSIEDALKEIKDIKTAIDGDGWVVIFCDAKYAGKSIECNGVELFDYFIASCTKQKYGF